MKNWCISLAAFAFLQSTLSAHAQYIDLGENRIGGGGAGAEWTIDKAFPGNKFLLGASYVFVRGDTNSQERGVLDERLFGALNSALQWGQGETGLEYYDITLASIVRQRTYEIEPGRVRPARDFWEWGRVRVSEDDPLGVDSYAELGILRAGRAWQKRLANRPITYTVDLQVSIGWAWARSFDPRYSNVSNPYEGVWMQLAIEHDRWGMLYTVDRVVTGTSLGSPKASMSREARIRFGYLKRIAGCVLFDLFVEKRSFNFSDEVMPSLYTKAKRYGADFVCRFSP